MHKTRRSQNSSLKNILVMQQHTGGKQRNKEMEGIGNQKK